MFSAAHSAFKHWFCRSSCLKPRPPSSLSCLISWMIGDKRQVDRKHRDTHYPFSKSTGTWHANTPGCVKKKRKALHLHKCVHTGSKTTGAHTCIQIKVHHIKSWQDHSRTQLNSSPPYSTFLPFIFFYPFHLCISSVNCLSKVARRRSEPAIWKLVLRDPF